MGKEILTAQGFEVVTVSNGQAALKMLQQFVPDLVLADIFMPGRNGYEVCQYLKSEGQLSHIPVVLLVGALEPYDQQQGRRVKADGLITKPFQSSTLLKIVRDLLASANPPASAAPPARVAAIPEAALVETSTKELLAKENAQEPETSSPTFGHPKAPQAMTKEPVAAFADLLEPVGTSAVQPVLSGNLQVPENLLSEFPTVEPGPVVRSPVEPGVSQAEQSLLFLDQLFESVKRRETKPPMSAELIGAESASTSPVQALEPETISPARPEAACAVAETTVHEPWAKGSAETESQSESGERTEVVAVVEVPQSPLASQQGPVDSPELGRPSVADLSLMAPQTPAKLVWTAEPAVVTPEDEKLFDETFPNWEELTKLVEQEEAEEQKAEAEKAEKAEEDSESLASMPSLIRAEEDSAAAVQLPEKTTPEAAVLPPRQSPSAESEQLIMNDATLEQLVRMSVEEMMPEIIDRIVRTVGETLRQTEK